MSDTRHNANQHVFDDRPYTDRDTLERLHVQEGLTATAIGKRFGVSHTTILNWLKRHEIERTSVKQQYPELENREYLFQRYSVDGLTQYALADEIGCTQTAVSKRLSKYKIPSRDEHMRTTPEVDDAHLLRELYLDNDLSAGAIADILGCHSETVYNRLHDLGIVRPPGPVSDRPNVDYYGPMWAARRVAVLERDGYVCRECPTTDAQHRARYGVGLHAHHIVPFNPELPAGPQHAADNLVSLCIPCHGGKHAQ